jgi:quercetin dioxygenase-like cupin family protein
MKIDFSSIKEYISDGDNFPTNVIDSEPYMSFREIIDYGNIEIWHGINNPENLNDNLTQIFNKLQKQQKKIYTVLPTKNNIESSRCHTCVLLKIIENENENIRYFPLFDMGGTESPENMVRVPFRSFLGFEQFVVQVKVEIPMKVHTHMIESFVLLEGNCRCRLGDKIIEMGPGDFKEVPVDTEHSIEVLTEQHLFAVRQRITIY